MTDVIDFKAAFRAARAPAPVPVAKPTASIEDSFVALTTAVEKIAELAGQLSAAFMALEKHAAKNSADIARIAGALGTILRQGASDDSE